MSEEINYKNNPLHGLSVKNMLTELVDYYGFEILYAYLQLNCFKTNPDIKSSLNFLNKTDWAREKVEGFYMYQYKSLPRCSDAQFALPPRDRIVPDSDVPGEPAELSLEDAERLHEKRAKKAAERRGGRGGRPHDRRSAKPRREWQNDEEERSFKKPPAGVNPWANAKKS